jgi:hypothetical protein
MAQVANTYSTYDSVGQREELSDMIWNIAPTETPFSSNIERIGADAVLHEWQTDTLATASTSNAHIEGDDTAFTAPTATVRLNNRCQIMKKEVIVSRTNERVKKAGRKSEIAYQLAKKGLELRRDIEATLLANQAKVTGDDSTARKFGSVLSYIATNDNLAGDGASPAGTGADARTDGTQRAFTEAQVSAVQQAVWEQGGNPDIAFTGAFNKKIFSSFSGIATPMKDVSDLKIIAAADIYVGDFGELVIVPNRFQRARDVLILQMDLWAIAELDPIFQEPLAKTGDAEKRHLITEFTLESRNEKGSGGVFDLTTS